MIAPARSPGREASVIALLGIGMAVSILPSFALGVLAVPVIADLDLSRAQLGLAAAVSSGVGALSSVWLGGAADRRGGGAMLVAVFALGVAALVLLALSQSLAILVIAAVSAAYPSVPRCRSPTASCSTPCRESVGGPRRASTTAGEMLAIVLVGLAIPTLAAALGWRVAVGLVAIVPAAAIIVTVALLRPSASTEVAGPGTTIFARSSRDLWWATAYATAMGLSGGAISPYLPLYSQEAVGVSATVAGLALSVVGLVAIPGRILWGRYAERTGAFQGRLVMLSGIALASALAIWGQAIGASASCSWAPSDGERASCRSWSSSCSP